MSLNFRHMLFNSIEGIDKLIEAIEKIPENPNKENTFIQSELTKREKMLNELKALRKEADEIEKQEAMRKEAEAVRDENDEIERAIESAKQLIRTKKAEVKKPLRSTSASYGSESSYGYGSGESRFGGESRW